MFESLHSTAPAFPHLLPLPAAEEALLGAASPTATATTAAAAADGAGPSSPPPQEQALVGMGLGSSAPLTEENLLGHDAGLQRLQAEKAELQVKVLELERGRSRRPWPGGG